jgi:hypothetical protein
MRSMARCLTDFEGSKWLEVVNPTRTKDLNALRILPGSPAASNGCLACACTAFIASALGPHQAEQVSED